MGGSEISYGEILSKCAPVGESVLPRLGRTHSGSAAFESLIEHFSASCEENENVILAPDSKRATEPLSLLLSSNSSSSSTSCYYQGCGEISYRIITGEEESIGSVDAVYMVLGEYSSTAALLDGGKTCELVFLKCS